MSAPLQKMVRRGATSQSVVLRFTDLSTGLPANSLGVSTAALVLRYWRYGDGLNFVSFAQTAIGSLSSSYTSGGWIPLGFDGLVRVDPPDAAWAKAVGVDTAVVSAVSTQYICTPATVQLVDGGGILTGTPQVY